MKSFFAYLFLGFILFIAPHALATPYATTLSDSYTYGPVVEGHLVEHTFILHNQGTSPLVIDKVDTGCGCILVSYPDEIAPGQEAPIEVRLVTVGYGGQPLNRKISVYTNDPTRRIAVYHISGHIDKFASVSERNVQLAGKAGKTLTQTVIIEPMEKYPFAITGIQTGRKDILIATLVEKHSRKGTLLYELHIQSLVKTPGKYTDEIYLLTDHPLQKGISIDVFITLSD